MASVVFAHFAASGVALTLRYQSRPTLRCASRFFACVSRCARCIRRYCCCCLTVCFGVGPAEGTVNGVDCAQKAAELPLLKWYWFHLFAQVGFAIREFLVISDLDGWCWEVLLAYTATWLTILIVAREVWHFSNVRYGSEKQIVSLDGLLDMLLLPVNIVFFCALCVRVLKLQPTSHLGTMVSVVIESADIYEAFALWSVLELFVKVVSAETANRDADTMSSFRSFKSISLQGVKAWVIIQAVAVAFKLVLEGLVAVYVPTFCFLASKSCNSCSQWYSETVATALSAVTFILCSFAIMFVFYFEAGYRLSLKKVEPMWKFLGVKGIVSVTYFQWIVISTLASPLGWDGSQVYLFHCLLYAFWMPLLAVFHTFLAYPYYALRNRGQEAMLAPWLIDWLHTINAKDQDFSRTTLSDSTGSTDVPQVGSEAASIEGDIDCEYRGAQAADETPEASTPNRMQWLAAPTCSPFRVLFYVSLGAFYCFAAVRAVLHFIPVHGGIAEKPLHNFTCTNEGDLAHFLQSRGDLKFALLNDTTRKWSTPGVAGAWLPLCSSTPVGCQAGHFAQRAMPSVTCNADGSYSWVGSCDAISCGSPPRLPHATPRMHDMERQNWTYGVVIHYDCDKPGYRGALQALCNITDHGGVWKVDGSCEEVTCGPPPEDIPNARPLIEPGEQGQNVSTGMVVRYQCNDMYNGTPTALCGDDGMYVKQGRCKRECGPPPMVPHASPSFDNSVASLGWFEGMRCPYVCDRGFKGFATALCEEDGNYTIAGQCKPISCGSPPNLPHATPRMQDVAPQNFTFGETVHYDCDQPRFKGQLVAVCNITGNWIVHGNCTEATCGPPPTDIMHAKPVVDPRWAHDNVSLGTVVRYQCDGMYNGTPTATCGDDGSYVKIGRCRKECGPPPTVPNAHPNFDNDLVATGGWTEGMDAKYGCDSGFEGGATAVCGEDGKYKVAGHCTVSRAIETDRLYRHISGLSAALGVENTALLAFLAFFCWRKRYSSMRSLASNAPAANHEMVGGAPLSVPLASDAGISPSGTQGPD